MAWLIIVYGLRCKANDYYQYFSKKSGENTKSSTCRCERLSWQIRCAGIQKMGLLGSGVGPKTYSHNEIAEMAFSIFRKNQKTTRIPVWMENLAAKMIRPFSKRYYTLAAFFTAIMQTDFDAPKAGTHSLKENYKEFSLQL